jgi:hypothetical protein
MTPTPQEAAAMLREAVTALSGRLGTDYGDLVAEASVERTAALVAKLERGTGASVLEPDEVVTLDSWIRLADSAMLHDDVAEAQARTDIASRLRAVRAAVTRDAGALSEDPRGD